MWFLSKRRIKLIRNNWLTCLKIQRSNTHLCSGWWVYEEIRQTRISYIWKVIWYENYNIWCYARILEMTYCRETASGPSRDWLNLQERAVKWKGVDKSERYLSCWVFPSSRRFQTVFLLLFCEKRSICYCMCGRISVSHNSNDPIKNTTYWQHLFLETN